MMLLSAMVVIAAAVPVEARGVPRPLGQRGCVVLARPVSRGDAIEPDMVEPASCSDRAPASLAYDRSTALVVAGEDLESGAYLGRVTVRAGAVVRRGATLLLVSNAGAVRVVRTVTALQSSRGGRVFVQDEDGQVFSARLASPGAGQ